MGCLEILVGTEVAAVGRNYSSFVGLLAVAVKLHQLKTAVVKEH